MRGGKEVCNGSPLRRYAAALSCRACPLRHLRCHLSQRERLWQAGTLFTGRLRLDRAQKGGPCYRGQQLLDKRTLSSCRWPRQRSTAASEILCFAHPDETCPACQGLPLWGQRRRPPPVAETGRSCWGRGQQDASGSEADAGSRNPALAGASPTERARPPESEPLLDSTSPSALTRCHLPYRGEALAVPAK